MPTWIAILIGAAGTWVIALIAIGGPIFRFIFRPRLTVQPNGFSGTTATHNNGLKARYYFVRVENNWRHLSSAHEVQLVLIRIQKSGAAGPEIVFDEIMPLPWQRQEYERLLTRTIGTPMLGGIFYVQEDGVFLLHAGRRCRRHCRSFSATAARCEHVVDYIKGLVHRKRTVPRCD